MAQPGCCHVASQPRKPLATALQVLRPLSVATILYIYVLCFFMFLLLFSGNYDVLKIALDLYEMLEH